MWTEIKAAYRESAKVAIARPLLFALPLVAEFTQHVIEYRIGMFQSMARMSAVADHPARMGFGQVKILSLVLISYWVVRQLANMDGARLRVLGDARSLYLFAGVILWSVATAIPQQFGGSLLAPFVPNPAVLAIIGLLFFVFTTVVDMYLTVWKVGAALGNARLGIPASFRIMSGNFWWSLGYFFVMFLPLIILHYVLNGLAVGRPEALLWPILTFDSLVVGYLGIVLVTTIYVIARRAAGRKSVDLASYGPADSITPSRASVSR
jgi:hypothetical protein